MRHCAWISFAWAVLIAVPAPGESTYSGAGWATLHRDAANRRLAADAPLHADYWTWRALGGSAVLTAPTLSPDGRTLYVTTGKSAGHSNLHAYGLDGELRWRSLPWRDATLGVDPCAILSSPIVASDGGIYVGDCNQLYAFAPDGAVKWVVPLPPLQQGDSRFSDELAINALTTAVFTKQGYLLGVTNFGDVIVLDRSSGVSVARPFRLPGLLPPASTVLPMVGSLFADGLVDPQIREWAWQLLMGGRMRSANTPAVDEMTGRIFVAATSANAGQGALYALDLHEVADGLEVRIAHATDMGVGSGSSPALSPDGARVHVSDEEGLFYAIDARRGGVVWSVETKSAAAAAAVGSNGDIYSLQARGPAVVAITPDGRIKWESDLKALAAEKLPRSWLLGAAVAMGNGNPTVVKGAVLVPVLYGYEVEVGRTIPLPVFSSVVALDIETGVGLRDVVALEDDSTGVTAALPDGTLINSFGTAITSSVRPLAPLARWLLPGEHRLLRAVGGFQVSLPLQR
ncbi:MAG: PQQ-binding-like beta-propeller repeat protein [Deltaproteobacteria bacterium]|nr:PQQ-binding-like beta-propeller repeat protein [Deltaproteobacteria bacterium]MBW2359317.1 PQQ-binding-like beta-propeller repeat protein [Deltaproteobacteria bacterium]